MNIDHVNLMILLIGYPPSFLFVVIYGTLLPWFRSWWGWALIVSSTSMSALMGIALAYRMWEWELLARDGWLRVTTYAFIAAGAWLMLGALLVALRRARYRKE